MKKIQETMKTQNNNKNILIAVLIFLSMFLLASYIHQTIETDRWHHNYEVKSDSMRIFSNKYDSAIYMNNSLILEKADILKEFDISRKKWKALEKALNDKITYYSRISGKIVHDTIRMTDSVYKKDSMLIIDSRYNDKFCNIDLNTVLMDDSASTNLNHLEIFVPLEVGLTKDYKIFVKSENPYFSCSDIQGAVVTKSQLRNMLSKFDAGLHFGIGCQYNLINQSIGIGPQIGIGINYHLF